MARFLIEVPHAATTAECALAVQTLLKTGSHFLTHADWGCSDGVHKGWVVVDVDNREAARNILPPLYRARSTVVALNKFTLEEIDDILRQHEGSDTAVRDALR